MYTNFNLNGFISAHVTGRKESLLAEDFKNNDAKLHEQIDGKSVLVIGGAGTIGSNYIKALLHFKPKRLYVIDINENGLTERHARSLLRLEDIDDRKAALQTIVERHLNVAQTDEYIEVYVQSLQAQDPPAESSDKTPEARDREKIRALYVFKDVRLFLNTVNRAVDLVRKSGINANVDKEESETEIVLTIKIPRRSQTTAAAVASPVRSTVNPA